jgi:drug/metabolite transporter (DMT)-like permease
LPHLPLTDHESRERLQGIGLICAAVTFFSLLDTCAKFAASRGVPTLEVVWSRYALSVVFSVVLLRPWRRPSDYLTRRPVVQGLRALFLLVSTALNFIAIQHLQLAQTVSITFAAPLIVTALAGPLLGEWAGPRRWAAVVIGFVGVLIVIQPEPGAFQPAALYSVGAAFCYAGYALTTRLLSATESPGGMLIYGSALSAVALTPALPTVAMVPPDWLVAGALVMTGIAAAVGHWFLILANRRAPATVLAPFSYTQLLSMIAAGYFVFGDKPHASTLVGALVIIASGLYIIYRERVHRDR